MQDFPPDVERQFRKEHKRDGTPLPRALVSPPALVGGQSLFLNAWYELDVDRPVSNAGISRITRHAIVEYCADCEFDGDTTTMMLAHIREMDQAYINFIKARTPKPKG